MKGPSKVFPKPSLLQAWQLNSLILSSQESCSSPLIIFVASSGLSPTNPNLCCPGSPRVGHKTPGGSHQSGVQSKRHLLAMLLLMQARIWFDASQNMIHFLICKMMLYPKIGNNRKQVKNNEKQVECIYCWFCLSNTFRRSSQQFFLFKMPFFSAFASSF